MAAGPAKEMWSRQGGFIESPDGKTRRASLIRAFTVELSASDPIEEAFNAAGLPLVNDVYPGTQFIVCRKLTPSRLAPTLALVQCDYAGEFGVGGVNDPPTSNEIRIRWQSSVTDEPIDQDINGRPLVNANNEIIEGITERIPDKVLTIERDFLEINTYALSEYLRSRNSDTFFGWPPGTVRFMDYNADNVITDGAAGFWKVSAIFHCRIPYNTTPDKAWFKRVVHEGFKVRPTAADEPMAAFLNGAPVTKPVLLKADGTLETDPDNAHWLEFETTRELPYSIFTA